jgi:hypothetical protein
MMKVVESSPEVLVLASNGWSNRTLSSFSRREDVARIVQHTLFWPRRCEVKLGEIDAVMVATRADAASGATIRAPAIHCTTGRVLSLSATDEHDADDAVHRIRSFLGLPH